MDYILLNSNGYIDYFLVNDTTIETSTKSVPVQVTYVINVCRAYPDSTSTT